MSSTSITITEVGRDYLRLHLAEAVGPVLLGRLIAKFGDVTSMLSASIVALTQVEGIGERRAKAVMESRNDDAVDREIELSEKAGARIICWEDPEYPSQLRHCDDPPVCLYVRGTLQPTDAVSIAIVGSRKCSRYGYDQARRFAALLAGTGFTVVSGMARGVDGYAHEGAISVSGRTVAVLGCGVDVVYPPEHDKLAEQIIDVGAIISEMPMGSAPHGGAFPSRNRIIAGMTLGTIVAEASKRSGALITARLASEYNREVFAIPGRLDTPTAIGTNLLIQKGTAKLVTCLEDVLDELGDVGETMGSMSSDDPNLFDGSKSASAGAASLTPNEQALVQLLDRGELSIDELIVQSGLSASEVTVALTMLRIKSAVIEIPGNRFALRRDV